MDKNTVFQISTAHQLILGQAEGIYSADDILKLGDFGIGARDHYDGELIIMGQNVFVADAQGSIGKLANNEHSPFAVVTNFEPNSGVRFNNQDQLSVYNKLLSEYIAPDLIYAIKIYGKFKQITLRSGEKQEKPYPHFSKIIEQANTFHKYNLEGTMTGFFFPGAFEKTSTSSFHFHFIDIDEKTGGHVCNFNINTATAYLNEKRNLSIILPRPES